MFAICLQTEAEMPVSKVESEMQQMLEAFNIQ